MTDNFKYRSFPESKKNSFFRNIRNSLRCLGAVITRSLLPFDTSGENAKAKNALFNKRLSLSSVGFLLGLAGVSDLENSPFSTAFLCAAFGSGSTFSYIGTSLASLFFGVSGMIQFISLTLIYLLRKTFSSSEFAEKTPTRLIYSLLSSLFIGTAKLLSTTPSADDFLTLFCFVSLCVICTYLYIPILCGKKQDASAGLLFISLLSICVSTVPAFSYVSFFGINARLIYAGIITLMFCKTKGPIFGCVAGFILGFACPDPMMSAPLGVAALLCGYLFPKSRLLSVISFPLSTLTISVYLFGFSALSQIFPFTACSALLFLTFSDNIPKIFSKGQVQRHKKSERREGAGELEKVSDTLSGISAIIYKLANHLKSPSSEDTGAIFDNAFSSVCENCSQNLMCYAKRECNLPSVRSRVISVLRDGKLETEEFSKMLLGKCIRTCELCDYINSHYSELCFLTMKSGRTGSVAHLYKSMSHLLTATSENMAKKEVRDTRLEKAISTALSKISVDFSHVTVYGTRDKQVLIHGIKADKIPCSSKELLAYLSEKCGMLFSNPSFDISDSADMVMKFSRGEIIGVEYAQCCLAKKDESVSGDTVSFFETDGGYFYSVIADGMGSGKRAAASSRLSCVFLEKLLTAGTAKNVCLELLNNLLLSKNDETFSGIDLLEIDKLGSGAFFIKAGAAPSFILRKSRLYKISSETPPVGIIHSFSAESTRFSLEKGDLIFMVSDGVIRSEGDALWLSELININTDNEPALLAGELIERAREYGNLCDDASACVIRII